MIFSCIQDKTHFIIDIRPKVEQFLPQDSNKKNKEKIFLNNMISILEYYKNNINNKKSC